MEEHALSAEESACLANAQFLLTKREVVDKNIALLYQLEAPLQVWVDTLPEALSAYATQSREGKVSIGENYLGLPYQIYDYPRLFSAQSTFALRTMIWWGKHISSTLHIAGEPLKFLAPNIWEQIHQLPSSYVGVNDNPWQHHFGADNYQQIRDLDAHTLNSIQNRGFLKIAHKWPLERRPDLDNLVSEFCQKLLVLFER